MEVGIDLNSQIGIFPLDYWPGNDPPSRSDLDYRPALRQLIDYLLGYKRIDEEILSQVFFRFHGCNRFRIINSHKGAKTQRLNESIFIPSFLLFI